MKVKIIILLIGLPLLAISSVVAYLYFIDQQPSKVETIVTTVAPVLPPASESAVVNTGKLIEPPALEIDLSKNRLSARQIQKKEEEYYQKFQQLVEEVGEFIDSTGQESLAVAKPERTVSDTLTIMARQESDEDKAKRLALEKQYQQEQTPPAPAILATPPAAQQKPPVVVSKDLLLYGDVDTAWVDERPGPFRPNSFRHSSYSGSLSDTIVSYQYTYGKRTVKRVEYSVCWGDTNILKEFFLQALKKEMEKLAKESNSSGEVVFTVYRSDNKLAVISRSDNVQTTPVTTKELKYWATPKVLFIPQDITKNNINGAINKAMNELSLISPTDFPIVKVIFKFCDILKNRSYICFDLSRRQHASRSLGEWFGPEDYRTRWSNHNGTEEYLFCPEKMYAISYLFHFSSLFKNFSYIPLYFEAGFDYGRYDTYTIWPMDNNWFVPYRFDGTTDVYNIFASLNFDIPIIVTKRVSVMLRTLSIGPNWISSKKHNDKFNNPDISTKMVFMEEFFVDAGSSSPRNLLPLRIYIAL